MTLLTCSKCNHTTFCVHCDDVPYRTNAKEPEPIPKIIKPSIIKRLNERLEKVNWKQFFNGLAGFIWKVFGIGLIILLISIIGFFVYKSATADGKIDYCIVDSSLNRIGETYLNGHRRWRIDANLGACSPSDCKKIAEELGCPFGILK